MHQHRCKPFPPRASLHDGIQNRGGGTGRGCRPGPATIPAPAPRVSLGGRESLSPCVPTPQPGSHILIHSVYSLNTHTHTRARTHTHTHTHIHRSFMFARARRRRGRRITGEGTKKPYSRHCPPSPPPDFAKEGEGCVFWGTGRRRHDATHTTRYDSNHTRERTPLDTTHVSSRIQSTTQSTTQGVSRSRTHPHTHTARKRFAKKQKSQKSWIFPTNPPNSCVVSP